MFNKSASSACGVVNRSPIIIAFKSMDGGPRVWYYILKLCILSLRFGCIRDGRQMNTITG